MQAMPPHQGVRGSTPGDTRLSPWWYRTILPGSPIRVIWAKTLGRQFWGVVYTFSNKIVDTGITSKYAHQQVVENLISPCNASDQAASSIGAYDGL